MKYSFLLFLLLMTSSAYSQNIIVEKVKFTGTIADDSASEIPKAVDLSGSNEQVVNRINAEILDRFMIKSFDQNEVEDFRWNGIKSTYEIKEGILYIQFSGEYVGAYLNDVEQEMFFDLKSGNRVEPLNIPFQALFTVEGYFDFLNKYWLKEGVKEAFKEAIKCAETEPNCSFYDIDYFTTKDKLSISLKGECYPKIDRACSPFYNTSVALSSAKDYLNDIGKSILIENDFQTKSPIDKYLEKEKLRNSVKNNLFLKGKINNKYPFSMAINIDKNMQVSGYYYYDSKREKIALKGSFLKGEIQLSEFYNKKQTGRIELKMVEYHKDGFFIYDTSSENSKYLVGKWMNPKKTKSFDIIITEIKLSNHSADNILFK